MAKVSPVSIKYMIHASLVAEGSLEKPDVIGALFGQTEGLLGSELDMRELQKEGKIGRIEVQLEKKDKRTIGFIQVPTALDQSETTLIAAAIETIERVGPSDAQIEIEKIEDVRGSKRDYILERAKKLMQGIQGSTDSREISNEIKESVRVASVKEYGENKLAYGGDLNDKELIVVEGRADVVNLVKAGIQNVIGMNGTKLPDEIKELAKTKEIILFVDGDRGGRLIAQNVCENLEVKAIAVAPEGKEVEELNSKEILMNLRKRVSPNFFFKSNDFKPDFDRRNSYRKEDLKEKEGIEEENKISKIEFNEELKSKLRKIFINLKGSKKSVLLNSDLEEIKSVSSKAVSLSVRKNQGVAAIIIDGPVTKSIIEASEEAGVQIIVASNFEANSSKIKLLSL